MIFDDEYEDHKEEISKICLRCKIGVVSCEHYSDFRGSPTRCSTIREKLHLR